MFPMFVYLLFKEVVSESSKIKETAEMKTNTREGTVLFFFIAVCLHGRKYKSDQTFCQVYSRRTQGLFKG